jgi:iron-sulfur cluster insertion protein
MAMADVKLDEDVEIGPALSISEPAANKLLALLQERDMPGHGLRVFVRGMGCSGLQYGLALDDAPEEADVVVETCGVKLYLDPMSSQYMWGSEIDYVETPQGGAFTINNPVASKFSCGSSGCSGCG